MLDAIVAEGVATGSQQVFHGEIAGAIDTFYPQALAAAIGFTPMRLTHVATAVVPGAYHVGLLFEGSAIRTGLKLGAHAGLPVGSDENGGRPALVACVL